MAHKLFVGGLNFATSNERLRELFAECGQVDSATVVTDRDTGRSRGFGFVEMSDDEAAKKAIAELDGGIVEGRAIKVSEARPREERSEGGGGGRSGGGGGERRGGGNFSRNNSGSYNNRY